MQTHVPGLELDTMQHPFPGAQLCPTRLRKGFSGSYVLEPSRNNPKTRAQDT